MLPIRPHLTTLIWILLQPTRKIKVTYPVTNLQLPPKNPVTFSETIAHVKEINTNESSASVASAPNIEVNEIDQEYDNAPKNMSLGPPELNHILTITNNIIIQANSETIII